MNVVEISYTLNVKDETVQDMKTRNGCRYWVREEEGQEAYNEKGDMEIHLPDGSVFTFNTESLLRGIALWARTASQEDLDKVMNGYGDHSDHDEIWQFGLLGSVQYA